MIIRHDIDDREYLDLGERFSSSLVYVGGCAGTLVGANWVLTAAHCVSGREDSLFTVRHLDRDYRVERVTVHPGYGPGAFGHYDIALIQLKEPVENGTPAGLYRWRDERGQPVVFIGRGVFGNGLEGPLRDDGHQRGATNTVIDVSEHLIGFAFDAPDTATALEGISGPGDSGGPAFITRDSRLYVAGVSSHQDTNGFGEGTYGVLEHYTRVSSHVPDVEHVMASADPPVTIDHPLVEAIRNDDPAALEKAARGDALDDEGIVNEAFCQSVMLNRIALAAALLARGVEARAVTVNRRSLYEFALLRGRKDYFDMLMDECRGSRNVHEDDSAVLPVLAGMAEDDPRTIDRLRLLLDQGANIDARTPQGDTALILAGWTTGNIDLVRCLIERGADVNLANENGDTPLIDAACLGRNEILELLLESGADPEHRNGDGQTALDRARSKGHTKAVELLERHAGGRDGD